MRLVEQIITCDPRPILSIHDPVDEGYFKVGIGGVEEIGAYREHGELWFAIYANGRLRQRVNGRHIQSVMYFDVEQAIS